MGDFLKITPSDHFFSYRVKFKSIPEIWVSANVGVASACACVCACSCACACAPACACACACAPTFADTQISGIDLNLTPYEKKRSEGVIFKKTTRSAVLLEFTMVSFLHLVLLVFVTWIQHYVKYLLLDKYTYVWQCWFTGLGIFSIDRLSFW